MCSGLSESLKVIPGGALRRENTKSAEPEEGFIEETDLDWVSEEPHREEEVKDW